MPISKAYSTGNKPNEFVSVVDFGAVGDDATNDLAAFIAAMAVGKYIVLPEARTYRIASSLTIPDDVILDLQGSTLKLVLTGTGGLDYGLRLSNRSWVINGTIEVVSSGSLGSQSGIHSPINIGPLYGDGGTVASPSAFDSISGWGLNNLTLKTNATGKASVSIVGGVNHGYIGNITLPDSSAASGIHLDWGYLGGVNASDVPATRTAFDAGTALTTHPNHIVIENINAGELTNTSAHLLRISGCHEITARHLSAEKVVGTAGSTAGIFHTAGDLGYEFASAEVKKYAHRGISIDDVTIDDADVSWGVFVDCFADNVQAAVTGSGYSNILPTIARTDISLKNIYTKSTQGASALPGFRIQKIEGGSLERSTAKSHLQGILIEESAQDFKIKECDPESNRQEGIYVGHASNQPTNILIEKCRPILNGTDTGSGNIAGIKCEGVTGITLEDNVVGSYDTEASQEFGFEITNTCTGVKMRNNHVEDVTGTGAAYNIGSTNDYGILDEFINNSWNSSKITSYRAGVDLYPIGSFYDKSGNKIRTYIGSRAGLTADTTPKGSHTFQNGDKIYYDDGPDGGFYGTICDVSGAPGTWARLTVA